MRNASFLSKPKSSLASARFKYELASLFSVLLGFVGPPEKTRTEFSDAAKVLRPALMCSMNVVVSSFWKDAINLAFGQFRLLPDSLRLA